MATAERASLRKADQTKGGGSREATITEIHFTDDFNYGGKSNEDQVALYVEFEIDGFQKPWDQNCTVGPAKAWDVVDNGDGVIRKNGKAGGLNESSNAGRFFGALEDVIEAKGLDFDEVLPNAGISALKGARVTVAKLKYQTVGGDEKEMFVIDDVLELGTAKKKTGGKGSASKGAADVTEKTEKAILELLEEKSPLKKGDIPTLISSANKKDPDVKAMTQLAFKDSFLFDEERPWAFDRKKGTLIQKEDE